MPAANHFKNGSILSDHAYQSTRFSDVNAHTNKVDFTVNVGSWNLQDKCVSLQTNQKFHRDFANSPYPEYDETLDDYVLRKRKQIEQIISNLGNGDDVLCLQEVDFLFPSNYKGKNPALMDLRQAQLKLKEQLETELKALGYNIVLTEANSAGVPNQKMAVIYNAERFAVQKIQGVLPTRITETFTQNRGFQVDFIAKKTGKEFVLSNLHLKYGHDYKSQLERYQRSLKGKCHVMYGDCNNVQNENLHTALGNWHTATNFSLDKSTNQLTVAHNATMSKAFDRAFGAPSTDHYLKAQPNLWCQEVRINAKGNPVFQAIGPAAQSRISKSRVNEHWRRGVDILSELDKQYGTVKSEKLLHEINSCAAWKGIIPNAKMLAHAWQDYNRLVNGIVENKYAYQASSNKYGRTHFFAASASTTQSNWMFKTQYQALQGDHLKTIILNQFKERIDAVTSTGDLDKLKAEIYKSSEYMVLKKGQGLFTKVTGSKTSSLIALEDMLAQKETSLNYQENYQQAKF